MRFGSVHAVCLAASLVVSPSVAGYCAPIGQDRLTLVEDGRARAGIVVDRDLSPSERWAVKELQTFVKQMSGAELPVSSDADVLILIGRRTAEKRRPELSLDGLGTDGYVVRTSGNQLVIAGGRRRGTMYGVYTLLEHLGCRWWTPTESAIPEKKTLEVPPMDLREVPKLEYRDMMYGDLWGRGPVVVWRVRNKVNGFTGGSIPAEYGGRVSFEGSIIHSYGRLLSRSKSFKYDGNRDMWALWEGKRNRSQPCLTNPDVVAAMAESVLERIRQHPEEAFVVVGQNDGKVHCQCENCRALTERNGSASACVIDLANRVAERVARHHPEAFIMASAYHWSRRPPTQIKPRDDVMVALSSIECDFGHPLATAETEENVKFRKDIEGWGGIAKRIYIWDYTTNFRCWLVPYPELDVIVPNVKFYVDNGAAGYFAQGSHTGRMTEFAPLRMWILAKAMWNPEADGKALMGEFLKGYYGPAAESMQKYIDAIHRPVREDRRLHVRCGLSSNLEVPWLAPEVIAEAEVHLREAEERAVGDDVYERRVRHAHMPIWYLLTKRDLLFFKSGRKSPLWTAVEARVGRLEFADVVLNFVRAARENNVNSEGEHRRIRRWIDWLEDYGRALKGGGAAPRELQGVDPKTYTLVQGGLIELPGLNRWFEQRLKGAPLRYAKAQGATDGWAVETGTVEWFVKFEIKAERDFKPGRRYRLFVRAKGNLGCVYQTPEASPYHGELEHRQEVHG